MYTDSLLACVIQMWIRQTQDPDIAHGESAEGGVHGKDEACVRLWTAVRARLYWKCRGTMMVLR